MLVILFAALAVQLTALIVPASVFNPMCVTVFAVFAVSVVFMSATPVMSGPIFSTPLVPTSVPATSAIPASITSTSPATITDTILLAPHLAPTATSPLAPPGTRNADVATGVSGHVQLDPERLTTRDRTVRPWGFTRTTAPGRVQAREDFYVPPPGALVPGLGKVQGQAHNSTGAGAGARWFDAAWVTPVTYLLLVYCGVSFMVLVVICFYPRMADGVMNERQWVPGRRRLQLQEARASALSEDDAIFIEEALRDLGLW
ncbi:MAG: hypothetical protein FRX48_09552 [Lasallia pustulata]|uniref:Transmembrane protein n=1 Tax=Lasallia pustulata TaxID=136370 RepID=A0A5M8PCE9_9LECA|nr:MAG: hypothetical protein FRX48_09552 [Lasallia pustulata]